MFFELLMVNSIQVFCIQHCFLSSGFNFSRFRISSPWNILFLAVDFKAKQVHSAKETNESCRRSRLWTSDFQGRRDWGAEVHRDRMTDRQTDRQTDKIQHSKSYSVSIISLVGLGDKVKHTYKTRQQSDNIKWNIFIKLDCSQTI